MDLVNLTGEQGDYFFLPQQHVLFGAGSLAKLAAEVGRLAGRRVLIVTTQTLVSQTQVVDQVIEALGQSYVGRLVTIRQHTPQTDVTEAARLAQSVEADLLVSVGGGSAIDATKAVVKELAQTAARLPHIAIPTTLSAAEFSHLVGVTDETHKVKAGFVDPQAVPVAVILDAALTLPTPPQLWLSSGIRALDHAIETLYAPGQHPLNDVLALEAIKELFKWLPLCQAQPQDLAIRTKLQLAAWMSFFGVVNTPMGLSHNIGRAIGATFDIPHGLTSCITLAPVIRAFAPLYPGPLSRAARYLGLAADQTVEVEASLRLADSVRQLVQQLGLPGTLHEVGLTEQALPRIITNTLSRAGSAPDQNTLEALVRQML